MAIFDGIGKKISDASHSVAQKGKEMTDSIRINSLISEEEKKVSILYTEIGKKYLSLYEGKYEEEMKVHIEEVKCSLQKIDDLNSQLLELKATVKCASCGAENPKMAQFCATCGTILKSETKSNVKYCACCSAQLSDGLRFCTSCGHPIEERKGE